MAGGFEGDIWVGRPNGTGAQQLTSGSASDTCPAVSPSGLLVAFCRSNEAGGYDLWIINADGSDAHQLTDFSEDPTSAASDPTFSSSLPRVAFVYVRDFNAVGAAPGVTYDIRSVRSDGTMVKRLTRSRRWHDFNPVFSPDGHRLLWVRTKATQGSDERTQLWVMRANGEGKRKVRNDINRGQAADWSPDGRRIVYRSAAGLKIVSPAGALERRIDVRGSNPVWSPNGKTIAFRSGSGIDLISRDGSSTRSVVPFWETPLDDFAWQPLPQ